MLLKRVLQTAGLCGLVMAGSVTASLAQTPGAEPSMGCRLFPLACPGPIPAPPPPLMGTPEDQAAAAAPPGAEPKAKHHRKTHKHASAAAAQ